MTVPRARTDGVAGSLLAPLLDADARAPRLTAYRADGGRTELSGRSLTNWAAKVAGLLTSELGLGVGDVVAVRTPAYWQTAPILLGTWWAGLTVTVDAGADVAFVPEGGDADADEVFVVSGHPLGAPSRVVAAHQRDFTTAVLPQDDRFGQREPGRNEAAVLTAGTTTTVADLLAMSEASAAEVGPGGRLLSTLDWSLPAGVATTLLAALAAQGSLVQVEQGADIATIVASERPTVTAGITVPGLPRIGEASPLVGEDQLPQHDDSG